MTDETETATRYGGPIDPYSPHGLRDVVNDDLPEPGPDSHDSVEWYGFFVTHVGNGRYVVSHEGHIGTVMDFDATDYDDVLELVDDLVGVLIRFHDFEYRGDQEGLVEWAGKMWTDDEEKASASPDLYQYVRPHDERKDIDGE